MISLVTGTLNRKHLLPRLIANTVDANEKLELVLVDGGSTDGTIQYLKDLGHPRIKLIEVGQRSSYPHFMNLGVKNATHDFICQWNDDVLLINDWNEVIDELKNDSIDSWLFSWQYVRLDLITNVDYCNSLPWNLCNLKELDSNGEIVMNYGVYRKELFKKFGLYDSKFHFYYADGELSHRFCSLGARFKNCNQIRVASIDGVPKTSGPAPQEHIDYYELCRKNHMQKNFQTHLEFLK